MWFLRQLTQHYSKRNRQVVFGLTLVMLSLFLIGQVAKNPQLKNMSVFVFGGVLLAIFWPGAKRLRLTPWLYIYLVAMLLFFAGASLARFDVWTHPFAFVTFSSLVWVGIIFKYFVSDQAKRSSKKRQSK